MVYCWTDVSIVTSSVDCCAVAVVLLLVLVVFLMRDESLVNPLATFSQLTTLEFFKTETAGPNLFANIQDICQIFLAKYMFRNCLYEKILP